MIRSAEHPELEPDDDGRSVLVTADADASANDRLAAADRLRARVRPPRVFREGGQHPEPYPPGFDPDRARAVWQNIGRLRGTPVRRRFVSPPSRPTEPLPAWMGIAAMGVLALGAAAALWWATGSETRSTTSLREAEQVVRSEREQARVKLASLASDTALVGTVDHIAAAPIPAAAPVASLPREQAAAPAEVRLEVASATQVSRDAFRPAPPPNDRSIDSDEDRPVSATPHASASTVHVAPLPTTATVSTPAVSPPAQLVDPPAIAVASTPALDNTPPRAPQLAVAYDRVVHPAKQPKPELEPEPEPEPTIERDLPASAPDLPVSPRDREPIGPVGASGIHLDRLQMATQDKRGACAVETSEFVAGRDDYATICFRVVHAREAEWVTVLWEREGQVERRARIHVPARHAYSTRARLRLWGKTPPGSWTVRVVSEDNVELAMRTFEIASVARGH